MFSRPMKRWANAGLALFFAAFFLLFYSPPAQADNFLGYAYGDPDNVLYYWESGIDSSMKTAWRVAILDWEDSGLVEFSSGSYVMLGSVDMEENASYGWMGPIGNLRRASFSTTWYYLYEGFLNEAMCTTSTIARSAANHELGHLFGLDHEYVRITIMSPYRNRSQVYLPTDYDFDAVYEVYH